MAKYTGTKADLQALATLVNKAENRPQKGVPYGGGVHVPIPDTYAPGAPGWLAPVAETGGELQLAPEKLTDIVTAPKLDAGEQAQAATLVSKLVIVPDAVAVAEVLP